MRKNDIDFDPREDFVGVFGRVEWEDVESVESWETTTGV